MQGQEMLRAFLRHCELASDTIDVILTRVESGMSYVVDLGHMDKDHVTSFLLRSTGA
jgi:hypothetical protein